MPPVYDVQCHRCRLHPAFCAWKVLNLIQNTILRCCIDAPPQIKLKFARHFTSAALGIENIINGRPCSEGRALSTIMCYCHCKIIPEPKSWKSFPTSFKCDSKWILLWELARLTSLFQIQTGRRNWNGKSIASGNYVINYFVFLEEKDVHRITSKS